MTLDLKLGQPKNRRPDRYYGGGVEKGTWADKEKPPKQMPGRTCLCGNKISRYNLARECYSCQNARRAALDWAEEEWARIEERLSRTPVSPVHGSARRDEIVDAFVLSVASLMTDRDGVLRGSIEALGDETPVPRHLWGRAFRRLREAGAFELTGREYGHGRRGAVSMWKVNDIELEEAS